MGTGPDVIAETKARHMASEGANETPIEETDEGMTETEKVKEGV